MILSIWLIPNLVDYSQENLTSASYISWFRILANTMAKSSLLRTHEHRIYSHIFFAAIAKRRAKEHFHVKYSDDVDKPCALNQFFGIICWLSHPHICLSYSLFGPSLRRVCMQMCANALQTPTNRHSSNERHGRRQKVRVNTILYNPNKTDA